MVFKSSRARKFKILSITRHCKITKLPGWISKLQKLREIEAVKILTRKGVSGREEFDFRKRRILRSFSRIGIESCAELSLLLPSHPVSWGSGGGGSSSRGVALVVMVIWKMLLIVLEGLGKVTRVWMWVMHHRKLRLGSLMLQSKLKTRLLKPLSRFRKLRYHRHQLLQRNLWWWSTTKRSKLWSTWATRACARITSCSARRPTYRRRITHTWSRKTALVVKERMISTRSLPSVVWLITLLKKTKMKNSESKRG